MKLSFSPTYFRKILKYQISNKSDQWERHCCMRTDEQTLRSFFAILRHKPKNLRVTVTARVSGPRLTSQAI